MRMSAKIKCIVCFLLAILPFTACEDGYDCSIENVAYDRIGFYCVSDDNVESKYKFPEALTVSLMVNGRDSIVVNHITDTDNLQLPMSYTSDCDTVVFHYEGNFTDTLYIGHENIPFYISMECGTVMYHRITGVKCTDSFIDSAIVANEHVKFDYNENIKVYFID